jgi:D-beta-D-heptose 7-phosphate kinase/D-beta-D-heptose 1-phosphate adenosyltransferase
MKNDIATYIELINSFQKKKILVIGDFILDVYLKGTSRRLSPEAPVPLVEIMEKTALPGGAANTVCNLSKLGASVIYCTVIGNDSEGDGAVELLDKLGIEKENIIRASDRQTIVKTRVVSGTQLVTRFDQGSEEPIDAKISKNLIQIIDKHFDACDAIIISDYDKGIIQQELVDQLVKLQRRNHKFIAVDSKRLPFFAPLQPSLVKPNYEEVIKLLNVSHRVNDRREQVEMFSELLFETTRAHIIAATLDADGSVIIEEGRARHKFPAVPVATPFVSGAGDTYLSAFTLASIGGGDSATSAEIATAAAAIAVKKEGTAFCSNVELKCFINMQSKLITTTNDLQEICEAYRVEGKRIVFTNGCFDILHSGHVTYLHCAKELGDVLVVGVNNDESIRRLKGENRPINPLGDRLRVLTALTSVSHVIAFGDETDDTPIPLITVVKPHIFCKGGDYTKEKLPEAGVVEACGGEIIFLRHIPDHSTTDIINRISKNGANGNSQYEILSALGS